MVDGRCSVDLALREKMRAEHAFALILRPVERQVVTVEHQLLGIFRDAVRKLHIGEVDPIARTVDPWLRRRSAPLV